MVRLGAGEPGKPGEPGEAGTPPGGAGGAGGAGGRGGSLHDGRFTVVVTFFLAVAVVLSIATVVISVNQANLNDRQDDAIQAAQRAEYRICVRQMINRAAINLDKGSDEPRLPLYDCTPNLSGHSARPLTPTQSRALERRVVTSPTSQLP